VKPGFRDATFAFLRGLRDNNDRDWFAAHRDQWVSEVRDPFAAFLEEVSERLGGGPLPLTGGRETMFRVQRDLRFSNDKRPYSESASGLLTLSGTKDEGGPLAYLELGPDGGRVGGGMHQPSSSDLAPVRRRIIDEPEAFDAVLEALGAVDMAIDEEPKVKTMPRGFTAHREHRHAEFVRCRQLVAMRPLPVAAWLEGRVVGLVVEAIERGLVPLYRFVDGARTG